MKKILTILSILIPVAIYAQDKYPYELPEYSTVVNDSTHLLYIDAGGIDKHIEIPTLLGVINDTADQLRTEIDSAKVNIRQSIGGGGIWERSGNRVTLINNGDSVGIGMSAPSYNMDIYGTTRIGTKLIVPFIYIGQNDGSLAWIKEQDGELLFWSFISGYRSLAQLSNFESVGTTQTTIAPTQNWNFGGTTASTQKMTITGDIKVTQKSYLADDILFAGANGTYGAGKPSVRTSGDTLQLEDYSGIYNLEDLIGGNVAGEFDTIHFSGTSSYIAKDGTTGLKLSPNGGTEITFSTLSAPYGRNIGNVESILFSTPSGDEYFRGFRNDTIPTDADTAMGWSISAIKKWVSVHGGGSGTLTGTMEKYAVPFGLTSSSLQIDETFHYNPSTGNLVVTDGFYTSDGVVTLDPTIANGETAVANKIGTNTSYSSNAKIFQVNNNVISEKFYVKNDTTVATNNLKYRGDLYSWKYRALTDTFGVVMVQGKYDTASLVIAAKGWEYKLNPFYKFFKESKKLKALPLPYPDGTERRQLNEFHKNYQIEFELERLNRYLKRNFDGDMIQYLVIGLLLIGFGYQQVQISKLKRK